MKTAIACLAFTFWLTALGQVQAQDTIHISTLEIEKRDTEVFSRGDSSMILVIDTLVMGDRSDIRFVGKKDVKLVINHAIIGNRVSIFGNDGKNNGTDFDINIRFDQLGSLFVLAGGIDANNGFRTYPNGNGGNVTLHYDESGIIPQTDTRRDTHYLAIDTRAGGYRNNPQSEIRNIYGRINSSVIGRPLSGLPQGQIYSGSPGRDGEVVVDTKSNEAKR